MIGKDKPKTDPVPAVKGIGGKSAGSHKTRIGKLEHERFETELKKHKPGKVPMPKVEKKRGK